MATNKNALIRYRTIDKCLQNQSRQWTLADLIDACSDALYEYEGKETLVSKRTVQLDIQLMRSNKLGYNAPIMVYDRKYYKYEEAGYSITDIPLTQLDMDILTESMEVLSQFKDISLFSELNGVIQKLEDKIYRESDDKAPIIYMEKNDELRGLNHLDTLYQAILKRIVLKIRYQSYKAIRANEIIFHGYLLKEFNNRWFVVGCHDGSYKIQTLALDRIQKIDFDLDRVYDKNKRFDADKFYYNTYGVTVLNDNSIIDILFEVKKQNAPYVISKPFHHSQQLIAEHEDGSVQLQIRVHHNYEIERLFLGFGDAIKVLKPTRFKRRLISILNKTIDNYTKPKG